MSSAAGERTWLGLDVGTSSTKAVLVTDEGTVLGRGSASYPTSSPHPGTAEQDPADYLTAVAAAIAGCGHAARPPSGVGLAGQTPTLVLIDGAGTPVRPALTWQDRRAVAEARELSDTLGDPLNVVGTSLPWDPSALPAKLLWLARHEPDELRRARSALQPKDFVVHSLTGELRSDPWSSKGLCTVTTHEPCLPVLQLAGVDPTLVPPIKPAWQQAGVVTSAAAARFGLPEGIGVAVGWSDALAGMLAAGAFAEPRPFALTGTSDIVGLSLTAVPDDAAPLYSVPATCAPIPVVYGPTSTSGAALIWLAELLGVGVAELVQDAATLDPDAEIPILLPYLAGERAPLWRPDLTGSLVGLRVGQRRAHLARGVMAGIACSERHVLDVAAEIATGHGQLPSPDVAVHTGGVGATAPAWLQVRNEIFGRPVTAYDEPALTAIGAAMVAAMTVTGRSPGELDSMRPTGSAAAASPSMAGVGRYRRYREESEHLCAITT